MIDRLLPLLLALTVAVPALTRPACCCVTSIAGAAGSCETTASELPPCCQAKAEVPPCCRAGLSDNALQGTTAPHDTRCGCEDCLSMRPAQPLAAISTAPRVPTIDDLPEAIGDISACPPINGRLSAALTAARWHPALDQPPPDRQAVLCVWTI